MIDSGTTARGFGEVFDMPLVRIAATDARQIGTGAL